MIKAIIFDFFGVVVTDALQSMSDELRQKNPQSVKRLHKIVQEMNKGSTDLDRGRQQLAELFGLERADFEAKVARGEVRNTALLNFIETLRENYKTAILSNVPSGSLSKRFNDEEFAKYFDIVTASGDIGYIKPDPEAYRITARRLGVEPAECVFIDDRENQVGGAAKVGMRAILYQNLDQLKKELNELLTHK